MSNGTVSTKFKDETRDQLKNLSKDMGLPRSTIVRRLVEGALRDTEGLERWKDAVLGPRLSFDAAPPPQNKAKCEEPREKSGRKLKQ